MIFNVDEVTRIKSGPKSWDIQKKMVNDDPDSENYGKESWVSKQYYMTIGGAINAVADQMVRESDAEGIEEALKDIAIISAKIQAVFDSVKIKQ
jgi:hypothetical protein